MDSCSVIIAFAFVSQILEIMLSRGLICMLHLLLDSYILSAICLSCQCKPLLNFVFYQFPDLKLFCFTDFLIKNKSQWELDQLSGLENKMCQNVQITEALVAKFCGRYYFWSSHSVFFSLFYALNSILDTGAKHQT